MGPQNMAHQRLQSEFVLEGECPHNQKSWLAQNSKILAFGSQTLLFTSFLERDHLSWEFEARSNQEWQQLSLCSIVLLGGYAMRSLGTLDADSLSLSLSFSFFFFFSLSLSVHITAQDLRGLWKVIVSEVMLLNCMQKPKTLRTLHLAAWVCTFSELRVLLLFPVWPSRAACWRFTERHAQSWRYSKEDCFTAIVREGGRRRQKAMRK